MTVLVAQNTKNKIILAADTGAFYGQYHKIHLDNHKGISKITQINDLVISSCGCSAELTNFLLFCNTRKPEGIKLIDIHRFFMSFGKWMKEEGVKEKNEVNNNYFLIFDKKLFHFSGGATKEILEDDFETDGAGFKEAYMAMYLGKTPKEAIDLTVEMNIWTSGEAQVVEIDK
jgi:hypothetical protein